MAPKTYFRRAVRALHSGCPGTLSTGAVNNNGQKREGPRGGEDGRQNGEEGLQALTEGGGERRRRDGPRARVLLRASSFALACCLPWSAVPGVAGVVRPGAGAAGS